MKVYISLGGELGYGSHIGGVFNTLEKAIADMHSQEANFDGGWCQGNHPEYLTFETNECDWRAVKEYEIQ
jgi:hypothetical protein